VIVGTGSDSILSVATPAQGVRYAMPASAAYSGMAVTRTAAAGLPAFYSAVRLLAQTGGMLPLRVMDDAGKVVPPSNLGRRLNVIPNYYTAAPAFWTSVLAHVLTDGNAFLAKTPATDELGTPELHLLHPESVQVYRAEDYSIRYDVLAKDGSAMVTGLTGASIIHVKAWTLSGETLRGDSPVSLQRNALGNAAAAQQYQGKVWHGGAVPRGVLSSEENLTHEQIEAIRESWQATYGGADNAGKVAVLPRGATYSAVSLSAADAQFIEQMQYGVDDIARMFNIPSSFIGGESGASLRYENATYNDIHLMKFSLKPILRFVESALDMDEDLFGTGRNSYWTPHFDTDEVIRPDIEARYRMYATGINGGFLLPDEARDSEGMPPAEGGDKLHNPTGQVGEGTGATDG